MRLLCPHVASFGRLFVLQKFGNLLEVSLMQVQSYVTELNGLVFEELINKQARHCLIVIG